MTFGQESVSSSSLSVHTLPEGTRLRDYEVTGLIGEGGFGIVYLAYDHSLQRRVAIKEYMPSSMASRAHASAAVVLKSDRHRETFEIGLKSFVNEARLLARFDHPSLVKVYRFWEENGTAYMVMPYYEGPTLKRALAELGRAPDEAELRTWLRPLLDALATMHAAHCFHRDIAPDNILLTPGGPLLLDFGAARRVIGDMTHALTVVLKPGFAPIEQYGEVSTMAQGAWTDLYALASVVYSAVTGHAPMSSVERLMDDRLVPLGALAAGRYSVPFLTAIDAALALRPKDRPQDVAAFRALLDGRVLQTAPSVGFASTYSAPLDSAGPDAQRAAEWPSVPPPRAAIDAAIDPPLSTHAASPHARDDARSPEPEPSDGPRATMVRARRAPELRGKALPYAAAAAIGVIALATAAYFASQTRAPQAVAPVQSAAPVPPPPRIEPVAAAGPTVAAAAPAASAPSMPMPEHPAAAGDAAAAAPPALPPPTRAARLRPEARTPSAEPAPRTAPKNTTMSPAKCSDILQKASLEPLTAPEAAYLKRECR